MRTSWSEPPPEPSGAFGGLAFPRPESATKALLWINGLAFLVLFLLLRFWPAAGVPFFEVLALQPDLWREWFPFVPLWQVLSYSFLHSPSDIFHLLFNLLALYFFGTLVEGIVGARRFLTLYLAGALVGGAAQLAFGLVEGGGGNSVPPTLGASGAVMATLIAAAVLQPDTRVIFILFPLRLRTLALILVGIDLFRMLSGASHVAWLVHLAGAAWGFLAVRRRWIWSDPLASWTRRRQARAARRADQDRRQVDQLLARIHEQGLHSLSEREKAFLKRVSGRKP